MFRFSAVQGTALAITLGCSIQSATAESAVSGSLTLTSDDVRRRSSQTPEDPALRGSFKWATESGFYVQVRDSNVGFASMPSAPSVVDATTGRVRDVNATHCRYPAAGFDLNWTALNGTLTAHDTDSNAERLFGHALAAGRVEAVPSVNF
jgi:hypothetical protein